MAKLNTGIKGLRIENGKYLYDRIISGQRIFHRFLEGTNEKTAEKWISKKIHEVASHRYLPESANCSLTVRDILNAYWQEHFSEIESAYKDNRQYHFDRIDGFFGGLTIPALPPLYGQVSEGVLTAAHVEKYIRQRRQDKNNRGERIAASTIQDEIDILSQAINFCMYRSTTLRIGYNPIKGFMRPEQPEPEKIMLDEGTENGPEWRAIHYCCSEPIKPLVLCFYETGMRPVEIFSMKRSWWKEVAPERWIIEFPKEFEEKTGKKRRIPVSKKLLEVMLPLLKTMKPGDLIFPSPSTGGIRKNGWTAFPNAVRKVEDMACESAKFETFTDFSRWADNEGWNEQKISLAWAVRNFDGEGVTPYALRRTRLSIWDAIDEGASRYVGGHVTGQSRGKDTHQKHYIKYPLSRLFRLVGLDYVSASDLRILKVA